MKLLKHMVTTLWCPLTAYVAALFEEGMTWLFDNCGGHGDTYGHYHYHAPPLCLLKSLGVAVPEKSSWWKTQGAAAWPLNGPEVQIGWALDGAPIMGPYKGGVRTEKASLDECHGAVDEVTGEYKYYLVPTAPYLPPCLRGAQLGNVSSFRSSKEGKPCSESDAVPMQTSVVHGAKKLSGTGCPEHPMFKEVHQGHPFGQKELARKLHDHGCGCGCGSKKYGTCPGGGGCGGCGCGCGCGTTTKAACGCGCGCGTTKAACGCGCGTTTMIAYYAKGCGTMEGCGCGCGCGTTTGCGCGCGCGTTTMAGCGGCGCGASYACKGQMFCAMGMTKNNSASLPVSMSQCNLYNSHAPGPKITIDEKQDWHRTARGDMFGIFLNSHNYTKKEW